MDHYQRSLHNLFTASPLDRVSDRRRDEQWLAAQQNESTTCFLPMWRLEQLVTDKSPIKPVCLSRPELHAHIDTVKALTFLGVDQDRAYFSVDLSASMNSLPESLTELGQFRELFFISRVSFQPG